jgi:hypothetical protein
VSEGTVYLIHFETPFKHAQHYIGWASDLNRRISRHRNGNGARLLRVVNEAGITWEVVRTWPGIRGWREPRNTKPECPVPYVENRRGRETLIKPEWMVQEMCGSPTESSPSPSTSGCRMRSGIRRRSLQSLRYLNANQAKTLGECHKETEALKDEIQRYADALGELGRPSTDSLLRPTGHDHLSPGPAPEVRRGVQRPLD